MIAERTCPRASAMTMSPGLTVVSWPVGGDECLAASHREPNWKLERIEIVPGGEEEVSQFGDEHGLD